MTSSKWLAAIASVSVLALGIAACGDDDGGNGDGGGGLSGTIRIDGSSTVAPLTEAVAERFQRNGRVTNNLLCSPVKADTDAIPSARQRSARCALMRPIRPGPS